MDTRNVYEKVAAGGMDVHYKFSQVTMRDEQAQIVRRERLDPPDRQAMREQLAQWPKGVPFVIEASFGWGWVADLMSELGLSPVLSNCLKVEQMRKARGEAKNNKKDADLLSLLPSEKNDWWRVWMAPPEVRDQREWMRYRSGLVHIGTQTQNRIHAIFHRHGVFHEFTDLFGTKGRAFLAGGERSEPPVEWLYTNRAPKGRQRMFAQTQPRFPSPLRGSMTIRTTFRGFPSVAPGQILSALRASSSRTTS